ncbi:muscarinic acetylcholine receptor M3 [Hydra vulgaris]|uniref:muscarinic acetylcholine receptor M3 n=1 Tax=Hydra vulgaris TaxID=6087 RepID=UPI001F5E9E8E|nr:muscarinic acetylcholine receptor M3-like [Hydra vulgaris]
MMNFSSFIMNTTCCTSSLILYSNKVLMNEKNYIKNPQIFSTLVMCGAGILSVVTILGNLLIIIAYFKSEKIRNISNVPILSLAFTDMFIGFYPVTMNIMEVALGYWPLGQAMCSLTLVLDYVSIQTSINHIVLINFDRYFSIKYPIKHRLHQRTSMVIVKLLSVWVLAFILWAPYINFYKYTSKKKTFSENLCYKQFSKVGDVKFKKYFFVITSVLGYFLPLSIVIVIYGKMYFILRQQLYEAPKSFQLPSLVSNSTEGLSQFQSLPYSSDLKQGVYADIQTNRELLKKRQRIKRHQKALKMIASIISAFLITGLPLNLQWILVGICNKCYSRVLFDVCNFLTYPNSTVNPFLYAYVSRTFRQQFKQLLQCNFNRKYSLDVKRNN